MKIAILICGQFRTLDIIIKNINKQFNSHDINYYICLSKSDQSVEKNIRFNDFFDKKIIKIIFLNDEHDDSYRNSVNYLAKIKNMIMIIDDKYDMYIIIRSDLYLENTNFLNTITNDNVLYFGNTSYNQFLKNEKKKINDNIIISKKYSNLQHIVKMYDYLLNNNDYLELVLYTYMHMNNISYNLIDFEYKLILQNYNVIAIAGDSGSGKSTLLNSLSELFDTTQSIKIETDRYHKWERGDSNYKIFSHLHPNANYLEKMGEDIYNLKIGHNIYAVDYDHDTGKFTQKQELIPKNNIIVCGLHTLYNTHMNDIVNIKIFMDTDRELIKKWKIKRDVEQRGYTIEKVLSQLKDREMDYITYIEVQKIYADIIINYYDNHDDIGCNIYLQNLQLFDNISNHNITIKHASLCEKLIAYNFDYELLEHQNKIKIKLKNNISYIKNINNCENLENNFIGEIKFIVMVFYGIIKK